MEVQDARNEKNAEHPPADRREWMDVGGMFEWNGFHRTGNGMEWTGMEGRGGQWKDGSDINHAQSRFDHAPRVSACVASEANRATFASRTQQQDRSRSRRTCVEIHRSLRRVHERSTMLRDDDANRREAAA